jgi:hypothetical protein
MGAFAAVSLPVDLTRKSGAEQIVLTVLNQFAGTRNVALDKAAGTVNFEIHFPGNLSNLVGRLMRRGIAVGERAAVSIPVKPFAPGLGMPADEVKHTLENGPEVWDVQFHPGPYVLAAEMENGRVNASIVPSTHSMHEIYDVLLGLRYMAQDVPTLPYIRGL